MILTCPACNTRYRVDDAILADPPGRELRCANCGHRWRYTPEPVPAARPTEPAPPTEPPTGVVPLVAAPTPEPKPATVPLVAAPTPEPKLAAVPMPPPRRGSRAGLGCLFVIVIIAAVIAAGVLARDRIVALWPPAAHFYRAVGLKLEPPGAGLEIGKMAPSREGDALTVGGDITNITDGTRTLPRLRIALRDAAGKELTFKVIDPPAPDLAPGATAHFKTQFEHPSDAATGVAVTFAR